MKKNLLKTVIILIAVTFVISCNKEDKLINEADLKIEKAVFYVENNILVFETPDIYEQTMEEWAALDFEEVLKIQEDAGFNSMYAEYKADDDLDNLPGDDIFLPLMLSPNSQIKIENYTFTLNFNEETVKAENDVEKSMDVFSFDHEVLPYLFEGAALEKGTYCDGLRTAKTIGAANYEAWIRYYRAGIYYSLYTQLNGTASYDNEISTNSNYSWENKSQSHSGSFTTSNEGGNLYYSIYKKTKRLKSYSTNLHFYVQYKGSCDIQSNCY